MMFLWLPLLFAIPLVVIFMLRPAGSGGPSHAGTGFAAPTAPPVVPRPDAMDIARLRLARGEISSAEFDHVRQVLLS